MADIPAQVWNARVLLDHGVERGAYKFTPNESQRLIALYMYQIGEPITNFPIFKVDGALGQPPQFYHEQFEESLRCEMNGLHIYTTQIVQAPDEAEGAWIVDPQQDGRRIIDAQSRRQIGVRSAYRWTSPDGFYLDRTLDRYQLQRGYHHSVFAAVPNAGPLWELAVLKYPAHAADPAPGPGPGPGRGRGPGPGRGRGRGRFQV